MDEILLSEIILVLLEKEEGVFYDEFPRLFHQIHGYQLSPRKYGYASLEDLLDDMKGQAELLNVSGQQLIRYQPIPQLIDITETFNAPSNTCWSQTDNLYSNKVTYTQDILSHEHPTPNWVVTFNSTKQEIPITPKKPSKEIVNMICECVINYHLGLKAKTLRKYIIDQHKIDLELYSKQLGYPDMLSLLKQIPGIGFAANSRRNVLISLGSHDMYHNSQPVQPKKEPFSLKKVADVLRLYPLGLRVEKLKQKILKAHNIDLEALSQELGYTGMASMLIQVPGITSLHGYVFFTSDMYEFSNPQMVQVENIKCSEKYMVDYFRAFPSGLKVEKPSQYMANKCKTDWKPVNRKVIYDMSYSKPNATWKAMPAKYPMNTDTKDLQVKIRRPQGYQAVRKPARTCQRISLPHHLIPSYGNPQNTSPQKVQQGLCPNVSYYSGCATNLRKDQISVHNPNFPEDFYVKKVYNAKATHPNYMAEVLPSSKIKDNLQLLLRSHANGLCIFKLERLYLFMFKNPLVHNGMSAKRLLMTMKDVVTIKGLGVQMKVFPEFLEDDPSVSANKYEEHVLLSLN